MCYSAMHSVACWTYFAASYGQSDYLFISFDIFYARDIF